jgi:hypothetical protein
MDYKKLIIINLACLLIVGKILSSLFVKMQKGLRHINLQENNVKEIFEIYQNITSKIEEENINLNYLTSNYTFTELQTFYKDYKEITQNYQNLNFLEVSDLAKKINTINFVCSRIKIQKLKVFIFVIFMIALVNYVVSRQCVSWANLKHVKDKVKNILKKMEKLEIEKQDENIQFKEDADKTRKLKNYYINEELIVDGEKSNSINDSIEYKNPSENLLTKKNN